MLQFKLQYESQENDELRNLNLQFQKITRNTVSNNVKLKKENNTLREENEKLIARLNDVQEQLNKQQNGQISLTTNTTPNIAPSLARRQQMYRDIRYFPVENQTHPMSGLANQDLQIKINELSAEKVRLDKECKELRSQVRQCESLKEDWQRRAQHLERKFKESEAKVKVLEINENKTIDEIIKDPRFMKKIDKLNTDQIEQLKSDIVRLNQQLNEKNDDETLELRNVRVKSEKDSFFDTNSLNRDPSA